MVVNMLYSVMRPAKCKDKVDRMEEEEAIGPKALSYRSPGYDPRYGSLSGGGIVLGVHGHTTLPPRQSR